MLLLYRAEGVKMSVLLVPSIELLILQYIYSRAEGVDVSAFSRVLSY